MTEHAHKILAAIIAATAGALVGWTTHSITLGPRVEAIERGQARVESLLIKLIEQKGVK